MKLHRLNWFFIGLLAVLLSTISLSSHAYHFPWDQGHDVTDWQDPDELGTPKDPNNKCGKGQSSPVYTAKGHFIWGEVDAFLMGRPSLDIRRTYNSHDPRDGIFGNGWSSNCESFFSKVENGDGTISYFHRFTSGKRFEYIQQADGTIASPAGQSNTVTITDSGITVTTQTGSLQEFNALGRLVKGQTEDGLTKVYEYDANNKLVKISSDSRFITLSYDSSGRVSNVQDHASRTWTYSYDTAGNLVSVADPLGGTRQYEYQSYDDTNDGHTYHQLTKITDASGVVKSEVVYSGNRVVSYTTGENKYSYSYDTGNKLVTKSDRTFRTRQYQYNDSELVTNTTDPFNNTSKKVYDDEGNLTQYTDKLGNTWNSVYDTGNRLLSTTSPLGRVSKFEFEGDSPKPNKIITAAGNTTTIAYDAKLHPILITDPKGNNAKLTYDASGNVSSITDGLGNTTAITYNASNKPLTYTDAKGNITSNTYDSLQRLATVTDSEGRTTTYQYDDLDRVVKSTNSLGHVTAYTYDASGRPLTLTDPKNNVTTYEYDSFGRLSKEIRPDGRSSTYAYNAANLLVSIALYDGKAISLTYDAEERIISSSVDGDTINYSYNARGDLTQISNTTSTISYTYNADGEQTQEVQAGITLDKLYNADSSLIQLKVLGQTLDYARDSLDLVTKLTNGSNVFDLTYDANSMVTSISMPNGTSETYTRDKNYNLTKILSGSHVLDYNHDTTDVITQKTLNGNATNYSYDALRRLTQAGSDSYNYDVAGNNLNNGAKYDLKTNQLIENDTHTFSYDASGNLTQKRKKDSSETKNYTFNARNQLTKVETLDGAGLVTKTLEFAYDPYGRRFSKTTNAAIQRYVYSGANIIAIVDSAGAAVSTFNTLGVDKPLSVTTGGNTYYYHRDHQGSIVSLSDSSGSDVETYAYDAYGVTSKTSSAVTGNPFAYTGREYDDDDLYYYRARYYDPHTQRFISQDPIEFAAGDYNFYRYVFNDPVNLTDPSGEIVPLLLGAWAVIEVGLAVYDAYDTARTILDPCKSGTEKLIAGGLFVAGALLPGGGYSKADDVYDVAKRACCFVAGTQVKTEDGLRNIEDIKLGDKLWAKNTETGEQDWKPVTRIFIEANRGIYEIKLLGTDGFVQKIEATDDHPFYVAGLGWRTTIELVTGDFVETDGSGAMSVISVIDHKRNDVTYNFEVADFHTYYVTKRNVLVHNCNIILKGTPPPNLSPNGASRTGAFKEAKRQSGIPTSQQPSKVSPNFDKRGNVQPGRSYEFEVPASGGGTKTVTIRDDAGGHYFGRGDRQNRGPHFNDEAGGHFDY